MKEKINAVRAIVPNKSNNEIILVLQHFDNCVDKTVQAFMEGSASEVLKEWTVTGKKKNKKKKSKPKPVAGASNSVSDSNKSMPVQEEQSAPSSEKGGVNGYHVNGAINDAESADSLSEGLETLSVDAREPEDPESAAPDTLDRTGSMLENGVSDFECKSVTVHSAQNSQHSRNGAKPSSRSAGPQFSSLGMEDVQLSSTNKKLVEILLGRQKKAELLKKMTDVAVRMSEEQLVELRADIKHFVSERKYDEDLGRVARFTCDVETLKKSIDSFGQVSHPKNSYSTRSRCSSVTSVSLSSPSDAAAAAASSTCASAASLTSATKKNSAPGETSAASANSSSRPCQLPREVLPGNRRGGQGYRPQGTKLNDPMNPGRHDTTGRYRNGSWYSSGSRYQSAPLQAPGNTSERGQTRSAGTTGTAASMEPSPAKPSFKKGLPQRKPRTAQPEAVNS
ncbi:Spermatogenesis-associated serine-rich protein 2 [Tupaia chinensis]|uniref:Spermatogenesis-associated serine-rich protein 2 n=1 Tax=Tupaia chinensis TaxID=246437 RepID=L8Y376_TUPCH|nr:Spermatogenesis-associated serine-rich protein 2 [Tupaia chinensis]